MWGRMRSGGPEVTYISLGETAARGIAASKSSKIPAYVTERVSVTICGYSCAITRTFISISDLTSLGARQTLVSNHPTLIKSLCELAILMILNAYDYHSPLLQHGRNGEGVGSLNGAALFQYSDAD